MLQIHFTTLLKPEFSNFSGLTARRGVQLPNCCVGVRMHANGTTPTGTCTNGCTPPQQLVPICAYTNGPCTHTLHTLMHIRACTNGARTPPTSIPICICAHVLTGPWTLVQVGGNAHLCMCTVVSLCGLLAKSPGHGPYFGNP